ncbi:acyltransferase family protein [Nocardiopsis aegyptia]|uniref:Surface polysaccharide O-acyltransferase-like enzyme n=1 Tax=Nocardiopsis aegyptia TaxID=220378 RepID=A0A7Z0JAN2_9ACTN|nr:acyltransferase [Nocardiopsis aegyptia]NYJ34967.1 surface polysaccharide O-acyltransferase-like enzyme [Nocardiopsis aegyptia]
MTVTVESAPEGAPQPPPTAQLVRIPAQGRPQAGRDRFLDVIRLLVMGLVVAQHWWLPTLVGDADGLTVGSVLSHDGGFLLTWAVQVMPLIFFVGGAANLISWRAAAGRGTAASTWIARRLRRLAWPVVPLAVLWIVASHALVLGGVPDTAMAAGSGAAGMVLWFLAVYVLVVVCTPVLSAAQERFGWLVPVVLFAGAAAVDLLRFSTGVDAFGFANIAFVWLGVHQFGFLYGNGAIHRRPAVLMAVGGAVAALALAIVGPYSPNMTGVFALESSNVSPPTLVLAAVGTAQVGVAVLLRDRINAWAARPGPARLLDWVCPQLMTVYLWHMVPLSVVAGVLVFGLGLNTPEPMTAPWVLWGALGTVTLLALAVPLARYAARLEEPPALLSGAPGTVRALTAAALVGGGLLVLTVSGLGVGLVPLLGLLTVVTGLVLTRAPR